MTEQEIMKWMQDKVKQDGYTDAANLAKEFLRTHSIKDTTDPNFTKVIDAGFKVSLEIYE